MGGDQHGHPLVGQAVDLGPELAPGERVHARGGLVEKEHLGFVHERHRQGEPLLVAERERLAVGRGVGLQAEGGQGPVDLAVAAGAAQAVGAAEEAQVLEHGQVAVQGKALGHVADARPGRGRGGAQVEPGHGAVAARDGQQAAEHAEGSGLAGPVGAEQAEDLATAHTEAHPIHSDKAAETPHQVVGRDHVTVPGRPAVLLQFNGALFVGVAVRPLEGGDEVVLEARLGRGEVQGFTRVHQVRGGERSGRVRPGDHPQAAAEDEGVEHCRVLTEPPLQVAPGLGPDRQGPGAARDLAAEGLRLVVAEDAALVEEHHLGAAFGLVQVGGAEQHAHALGFHQMVDDLPEFAPRHRVHAHGGLVEQEQARRPHQGADQAELLFHAAGEAAGQPLAEPRQPGHGQQLVVAFGPSITGHTLQVGVQVQVLLHAQVLVEPEALRHVADIGLHGQGFADCIDGEHAQAAPVRGEQAGAEPHEGGFAGAVRADQAGDPVGADGAADPVQGGQPLLSHREGLDHLLDHQGRRGLELRPGRRGRGFGHEPGCGSGPQGEAGTDSGGAPGCRVTVTGMPRRSSCWGSQTKMRAR